MKELKVILAGCVAIVFGSGCSTTMFIAGVPGSGVSATESREIENFTEIEFSGSGKVNVVCGGTTDLQITADDNLLEYFETEVDGDTLIIRSKGSISPTVKPTFDISTDKLDKIELTGSGDVDISDVRSNEFEVLITGSGRVNAMGRSAGLIVGLTGSGHADLSGLMTNSAKAKLTGSGSATVFATQTLDASILGSGSLKYAGQPDVKTRVTGSGNVRQIKTKSTTKAKSKAAENKSNGKSEDESNESDEDEDGAG